MIEATKIWSLQEESPQLWKWLLQHHRFISDVLDGDLNGHFPLAKTLEPFEDPYCARPANHMRAFYIKQPSDSVIAVKGSEAADDQLEEALQSLTRSVMAGWTAMEIFPLREQKLPYAVLVPEAVHEANVTVRFLEKYVQHFNALPVFPLHLAIYRMPESVESNYFSKVNRFASARAREACKLLGKQGLAVYTYYLPVLPIRMAHIIPTGMLKNGIVDAASRERVLLEKHKYDAEVAVENFLALAGRMLSLGFFPLSMDSYEIGYCTSPQNITVNGGMCDSGSLMPFDQVTSDWDFANNFLATLSSLCLTAKLMLHSPLVRFQFEFNDPSQVSMLVSELVWGRVRSEVESCMRSGVNPDARLQEMLAPPSYGKVRDVIKKMYPERAGPSRHLLDGEVNMGFKPIYIV